MIAATIHQDIIANVPQIDQDEFRLTSAGGWATVLAQTNRSNSFVSDDYKQKAALSTGHTLKFPAYNFKNVTVRSTRPLVIPDDENTSQFVTVTPTTFAFGFTMRRQQHFNNYMDYARDWMTKYKAGAVAMRVAIENAVIAHLELAKTQVVGVVTGDNLAFSAGHVLNETGIGSMKDSYVLSQIRPILNSNDYYGESLDIVANQGLHGAMKMMDGFGGFNQEDKTIQFLGNNFAFSNQVSNAVDKKATFFAIADNQVGMATRVEPDSLSLTRLRTGHEWGRMFMPELGIEVGTYYYEDAVDMSALHAGTSWGTRTGLEAFDFAVDIFLFKKHNSNQATIPSGILKGDIAIA